MPTGTALTVGAASRTLSDDTLLVFLSDCHIGGDPGRDIFETPDDLSSLFDELAIHPGPVELVLAGDFFDFLRMGKVLPGENRASQTMARLEYTGLFEALRRFAAGEGRHVVYMPGNHDAEAWWNPAIQGELKRQGLVHEFALSYAAVFQSDAGQIVYCEHGNEFDPANAITDYADPLDTPLGDHIVTDFIPRLPKGRAMNALHLREIDRVFPLAAIPHWLAGRLFYEVVTQTVKWVLLPLLLAYAGYELVSYAFGFGRQDIEALSARITYETAMLLVAFAAFFWIIRRVAHRASAGHRLIAQPEEAVDPALQHIQTLLESGTPPPLAGAIDGDIAVFVSGHTHAPSLTPFQTPSGLNGALVNSGCWLRQLRPLKTYFGAPTVLGSIFVQPHVLVTRTNVAIEVALWERPRPFKDRLQWIEWLAIAGRLPKPAPTGAAPRMIAKAVVGRP